ncbi:NAD(P)-dependent glycerol-3-phosphate dehydrogenase [Martelella lutilitoris]|uniref:Glycerol-3-phosphate dehydrogenase [NAD(P)+] n=1 Tax=Martelella lutilitoris TaxID=2583532 RepID=A0A7T7HLS5_9HYPH|nr:NAD(P)H-dependent glycerol-3-phosphate dehydrogenase [Martelella lutilitoris]QQM31553.1 NAD(P)-dependent glycerol-3-phosphate dehydrogenase [Martelella lutilitoris]
MSEKKKTVVIGSGAFGTALAAVFAHEGEDEVTLLGRNAGLIEAMRESRRHEAVLPGITLPEALNYTIDPSILGVADTVVLAVPAQAQRAAALYYAPYLNKDAVIVSAAKGIERASGRLITDVLNEALPHHHAGALSGPGFAIDLAGGKPIAMALAFRDRTLARETATILSGRTFRIYASGDPVGVQIGGALKNVLAIACGIVEGADLGESARAALIARGLAEMSRLAVAMGGEAETVRGLSGLGDLVLTGSSRQSRNFRYGVALAEGNFDNINAALVEGVYSASVASELAESYGVQMPISNAVARVLDGKLGIPQALEELMTRPITTE